MKQRSYPHPGPLIRVKRCLLEPMLQSRRVCQVDESVFSPSKKPLFVLSTAEGLIVFKISDTWKKREKGRREGERERERERERVGWPRALSKERISRKRRTEPGYLLTDICIWMERAVPLNDSPNLPEIIFSRTRVSCPLPPLTPRYYRDSPFFLSFHPSTFPVVNPTRIEKVYIYIYICICICICVYIRDKWNSFDTTY